MGRGSDPRALLVGLGDSRCLGGRIGCVVIVALARLVVGQERVELGIVALAAGDRGRQGKPRRLVRRASRAVLEERVVFGAALLDRFAGQGLNGRSPIALLAGSAVPP